MEQTVSYTLDSTLETVDHAEEKATRIATELGFGEDEVMQISMAVAKAGSLSSGKDFENNALPAVTPRMEIYQGI